MSLDDVLKWGSNRATSPPWAVTSSRFWVAWPAALAGTGAAPPRARIASAASSSRRVTSMGGPPVPTVIGVSRGVVNRRFGLGPAPRRSAWLACRLLRFFGSADMAKTKRIAKQTKTPTRKLTPKPARPRPAPAPAEVSEPESTLPAVRTSTPERGFAARFKPPAPSPALPAGRRAIFVDVENSSRADPVSRVLDPLAIDRQDRRVDLIAVGNWRVIGADSARLMARRGAHLVHSAPSTGVKDWSDLRIAVSAGVWLGSARPGDLIEIISDDRAFDAVGDVAALLGVEYRRLSHRGLIGAS